jgi:hypothetical protein
MPRDLKAAQETAHERLRSASCAIPADPALWDTLLRSVWTGLDIDEAQFIGIRERWIIRSVAAAQALQQKGASIEDAWLEVHRTLSRGIFLTGVLAGTQSMEKPPAGGTLPATHGHALEAAARVYKAKKHPGFTYDEMPSGRLKAQARADTQAILDAYFAARGEETPT